MTLGVTLKKHPLRWRKLPISIRQKIVVGVDRVVAVRAEIERAAKSVAMPPIIIVDIGWVDSGNAIFAATNVIRIGKEHLPGVILPASTVVCIEGDAILRTLLVHEFSHAFYLAVEAVRAHDGLANWDMSTRDALDWESDDECHIVPDQWFGEFDASHFSHIHDDAAMDAVSEAVAQKWIAAGLPTEAPSFPGWGTCDSLIIPTGWVNHLRAHIMSEPAGNPEG